MTTSLNPARRYGGHGDFPQRLAQGGIAEAAVARWLETRGRRVTILARTDPGQRAAPKLHGLDGSVIAPDLLVAHARSGRALLLEVKGKTAATWHRFTKCWTTGVTAEELRRYQQAEARTGMRCWLAFVQGGKCDRFVEKAPPPPEGLYVAPVANLEAYANHSFEQGDNQRLYWSLAAAPWCHLAPLADLELNQ